MNAPASKSGRSGAGSGSGAGAGASNTAAGGSGQAGATGLGASGAASKAAADMEKNKVVLTMDDLTNALNEHGVNAKKPDYCK